MKASIMVMSHEKAIYIPGTTYHTRSNKKICRCTQFGKPSTTYKMLTSDVHRPTHGALLRNPKSLDGDRSPRKKRSMYSSSTALVPVYHPLHPLFGKNCTMLYLCGSWFENVVVHHLLLCCFFGCCMRCFCCTYGTQEFV